MAIRRAKRTKLVSRHPRRRNGPPAPRRPDDQPRSLLDMQRMFPDEAACAVYLERVRYPDGFVCPYCGAHGEPYRFAARPEVLRCRACRKDTSLTAGTVMHKARMPLQHWFWAAYLATTQTPGESATQLQRQLGYNRHETAFQMLHKLRAGMVRPGQDLIGGEFNVEMDEAFVGGKTRGLGRGVTHASIVVGAVEVRWHQNEKTKKWRMFAGRLRLRHIVSRERAELEAFTVENILPGTTISTDGWLGYDNLPSMGYVHRPMVLHGDPEKTDEHLPMIHIIFSNLKTKLRGTYHGVSPQHLQAYLNEYVFVFNRRFYPFTSFASVLGLGTVQRAPTYEGIYSGTWAHRTLPEPLDEPRGLPPPSAPNPGRTVRLRRFNRR